MTESRLKLLEDEECSSRIVEHSLTAVPLILEHSLTASPFILEHSLTAGPLIFEHSLTVSPFIFGRNSFRYPMVTPISLFSTISMDAAYNNFQAFSPLL